MRLCWCPDSRQQPLPTSFPKLSTPRHTRTNHWRGRGGTRAPRPRHRISLEKDPAWSRVPLFSLAVQTTPHLQHFLFFTSIISREQHVRREDWSKLDQKIVSCENAIFLNLWIQEAIFFHGRGESIVDNKKPTLTYALIFRDENPLLAREPNYFSFVNILIWIILNIFSSNRML